ncbi:YihY/virulence factor BrkB family protein [Weissella diestrammenae]|uniref:YihY/virulence factor BrkB family protein n=1 Tax=Weissella diestrammenae TaxID=1162633 RepID=A0A7G9T7A9_9LACO|nr:YihY/virulence factor BrkB family protein [Weissella diestrammenae]MCM0581994.1 YihY/virulence factor BrkB family protein [Weissella diestrammenae]QNN75984.1 YihY/virulence factor BrkB family protein [Weissella diestrammenae]
MKKRIAKILANSYVQVVLSTFRRINLGDTSATIAYYALLALFPAIMLLAALLPLVGLTTKTVMTYLDSALPATINKTIMPMIESILHHPGVGTLSISIIVTLWSLSKVIAIIRQAQNAIYDVKVSTNSLLGRAISLVWMIFLLGLMGVLFIVASIGGNILEALPLSHDLIVQLDSAKTLVVAVGLMAGLSLFNFLIPARKPRFVWVVVGTLFQLAGILALAKGFGIYVKFAGKSYSFYQAIGSVVILMIWLNLVATIAMIGTIITAILNELWPSQSEWLDKLNQTLLREK